MKIHKNKFGSWIYRVGIVALFFLLIQVPPMAVVIANRYPNNQELAIVLAVLFVLIFLFIISCAWRVYRRYNQLAGGAVNIQLVIGGYLLLLIGMAFFGWLNQHFFHQTQTANNEIIRQLLNHNQIITLTFAVSSFTLTPVAEELIFRGILTNLFFKQRALWPKMLLSGLVFSAAHTSTTVVSFLLYCFMGMVLTYVYRQSGSLKNSILVHALNNFVAMAMMLI